MIRIKTTTMARGKQAFAILGLATAAAVIGSVPAAADDHASGPAALRGRPSHTLRIHDDHASTAPRLFDDHASTAPRFLDDHASRASLGGDDHASDNPLIVDDHASDSPLILDDHASGGNDDHASGPAPSLR